MKYFIDTEFVEEPGSIDLISIGIIAENGQGWYAISKDFNVKKAWNVWQTPKINPVKFRRQGQTSSVFTASYKKEYWIRDNILKPIFNELVVKLNLPAVKQNFIIGFGGKVANPKFTLQNFKRLIKKYGLSRKEMSRSIINFVRTKGYMEDVVMKTDDFDEKSKLWPEVPYTNQDPEFYAYYADYDWVVFCWIFGRMIELPKGFPQYCIDLKQMMQEYGLNEAWKEKKCPDPHGEHNALFDAKWNKLLYERICEHKVNSEMIFALKYANYKVYKNADKDLRYGDFSEVRAFFNEEIKYDIEFLNLGTKNCQS